MSVFKNIKRLAFHLLYGHKCLHIMYVTTQILKCYYASYYKYVGTLPQFNLRSLNIFSVGIFHFPTAASLNTTKHLRKRGSFNSH